MPTKNKKRTGSQAFLQALVDEVPKFDEMIIKDIRPQDSWVCHLPPAPPRISLWNRILTWIALKLKLISEWLMPKSEPESAGIMGSLVEETQDRFRAVWPNVASDVKRVRKKPKKIRNKK